MKPTYCYTENTVIITGSGNVPVPERCNGWAVANTGLDIATVNNRRLLPGVLPTLSGESFGVSGNAGELYNKTHLEITFQTLTGPQIQITFKTYLAS